MGKVTIIIECPALESGDLENICHTNIGGLRSSIEYHAGDPNTVEVYIVPDNEKDY